MLDACSIAFKVRGIDHHQSFGAIREESRTTMMNLMCDVAEYLVEVGGMSRVSCTYMSMCMSMYMSMYVYMLYQSYMMMRLSSKKCGHHRATFVMSLIRNSLFGTWKGLGFEYFTFCSSDSIVCHSSIFG